MLLRFWELRMNSKNIVPVFVPHCGCPHDCAFCNQKKITQQNAPLDSSGIRKSIENYLHYFKSRKERQIAFYGGSFTGIPKKEMIEYLKIGNEFIEKGEVDSLRLSTRPDYINEEILGILKSFNVKTIELGVQSMDDAVLSLNRRGHTAMDVVKAAKMIRDNSFELGLQMMIGLYGDSLKSAFFSAENIADLKPDFVRIYPTLTLADTYLEELYHRGVYTPLKLEEAVFVLKKILPVFYRKKIPVIRVGLQPSEEIAENKSVIAGPFHPSIRMLAEEELYYSFLEEKLRHIKNIDHLIISAPHEILNYFIGLNKRNKNRLIEKYKIKTIGFRGEKRKDIEIIINKKSSIRFIKEDIFNQSL